MTTLGFWRKIGPALGVLLLGACTSEPIAPVPVESGRQIIHAAGVTLVPRQPQRIVVLDYGALESAIALEHRPLGATLSGPLQEQPAYLRPHLESVQNLGQEAQSNLETVVRLDPDLILGCVCTSGAVYEQLSQIAPTVLTATIAEDWQQNFLFYGRVLGRPDRAKTLLKQYRQRLAALQVDPSLTVSVVRIFRDRVRLYLKRSFSGQILEQAGIQRPPAQQRDRYQQEISKENWALMDADVIFVIASGNEASHTLNQMKQDPLWSQLKAVQTQQVYEVPDYWVGVGILAAHRVIDDLERLLPNG